MIELNNSFQCPQCQICPFNKRMGHTFSDVEVIEEDSGNAMETEADESDQAQEVKFLNGDPQLPIFNWMDCEDDEETVSILLNPTRETLCQKVPLRCQQNISFLIDTRSLKHPIDWKPDHLGSFHNVGRVSKGFFDASDEVCFLSKSRPPRSTATTVQLKKNYWTRHIHSDFKSQSFELWSTQGKRGRYVIVRYEFEDEQHPISNKPHRKAKPYKPFARSKASTVQKIKVKTLTEVPSHVYDEVFEEAGRMIAFDSLADIPKGRKQVENFKYNSQPHKSKDELYDLVQKSRAKSKPYIRRIQLTPETACILAKERTTDKRC